MAEQSCLTAIEEMALPVRAPSFHFPYVDVARAVAIILVLFVHLIYFLDWQSFPSAGILNIFRIGWIGVDLFYVISGFVISLSLTRAIENLDENSYKKPYFKNRLARIVPLYFLTCWCYLVLVDPQWFSRPVGQIWTNILSHTFFVHNLFPEYSGALNSPTWTIAIEMQFYVFMAIVFKWLPRHRPILVCCLFIMLALAWRAGAWYTFDSSLGDPVLTHRVYQFSGTLDAFGLGCAIALIVRNRQHPLRQYLQANWKNTILWVIIAMVLSVASLKILWSQTPYWRLLGMVIFFRLLLAAAFAAWICFLISLRNNLLLTRILSPLIYIGKISYGVYLWHMLIILSIAKIGISYPAAAAGLVILLVLVISSFTWHFFEQPLIRKYHDKPSSTV